MSNPSPEKEELTLEVGKAKLFNDVLKYILRKTLSESAGPVLDDLEKVFFERWAAVQEDNQKKAEELEVKERGLVDKLLNMSKSES